MTMHRPTYLELVPPAGNVASGNLPSLPAAQPPLTACGGVQLPEPDPTTDIPAYIAADVALRRMGSAIERFRDAERALQDGMAALAAIPPEDPRRHFAEAMLAPLVRASRDVESVLDSMHQVGVQ
ncbi:hypothetical protein LGT39_12570 [Demequina sp. TTPB684]|uniref:hypothetical protein n=1 Tax=unclassified Demequina TaxID=2620311 RepID=UPI001CF5582C|nr:MULTISPECIES: hypothetical protein [unclassified Demequina]MCB2413679.1 hypothetical protein [Demequina sp. TTPB684]UPU87741.1 hypothetical protein LGT36_010825 [Demequina sp. TMPB413]